MEKELIDYAYPCMMAEKALKNVHDAVLDKDFKKAIEETLGAIVKTQGLLLALVHMKDEHDKYQRVPSQSIDTQ